MQGQYVGDSAPIPRQDSVKFRHFGCGIALNVGPFWLMNQSDAKLGVYGMSAALSAP
jgi:hypothetical protein